MSSSPPLVKLGHASPAVSIVIKNPVVLLEDVEHHLCLGRTGSEMNS
jgi:hypothetical protein